MKSLGMWIGAALLMVATGAAHADSCSPQNVTRTATLAREADRTLSAITVADEFGTDVPVAGQKAVAAMKDRLNDYAVAVMTCASEKATSAELDRTLARFAGVKLPGESSGKKRLDMPRYGGGPYFHSRLLARDAIGIEATIGIACGEDTMLMIFERRRDGWVETLRTQSPPYKTVAGGWMAFDYGVSPRDKDGHWFVVTKNIAPWCSSTWSEIRYAVLRPGADTVHPRTLLSKSDSIWWGADRYGDLKVDARGFDLRWRAESMDSDVHNREWIAHYAIDGDRVVRATPIAESPRDFADEWVRLDWREAKDWTAVANYDLRPLHDQLRKQHYFSYQSVRRCSDGDHTQIEVEPVVGDQRHVFFQVSGKKVFVMGGVGFKPDSHCKGPNLFDINKPQ